MVDFVPNRLLGRQNHSQPLSLSQSGKQLEKVGEPVATMVYVRGSNSGGVGFAGTPKYSSYRRVFGTTFASRTTNAQILPALW